MARSKSRKVKRKRKRKQKQFDGLKNKLRQSPFGEREILTTTSGEVKMSEVLIDFIQPYLKFADTKESYRKLVILGIMAWNASLLPKEEGQDMVDSILSSGIPTDDFELKTGLEEIVNALLVRKKAYFSEYRRVIINYDLTDTGEDYHLSVASAAEEPPSH